MRARYCVREIENNMGRLGGSIILSGGNKESTRWGYSIGIMGSMLYVCV